MPVQHRGFGGRLLKPMQAARWRRGVKLARLLFSREGNLRLRERRPMICGYPRRSITSATLNLDSLTKDLTKSITFPNHPPLRSKVKKRNTVPAEYDSRMLNGHFNGIDSKAWAPVAHGKSTYETDLPEGKFRLNGNQHRRIHTSSREWGHPSTKKVAAAAAYLKQTRLALQKTYARSFQGDLGASLDPTLAGKQQEKCDEKRRGHDVEGLQAFDGTSVETIALWSKLEETGNVVNGVNPKRPLEFPNGSGTGTGNGTSIARVSTSAHDINSDSAASASPVDMEVSLNGKDAPEQIDPVESSSDSDLVTSPAEAAKNDEPGLPSAEEAPQTEQPAPVERLMTEPPPDVFMVLDVNQAKHAMGKLREYAKTSGRIFACDTEVMDIDLSSESPCGHGKVICFSVYCGEDGDFSDGSSEGIKQPHIWVDLLDKEAFEKGNENCFRVNLLEEFREFFESEKYQKCWHNYGFDRHVIANPPFNVHCKGFAGDTMHMARLWDSSRKFKGYSLEALSSDKKVMGSHVDNAAKTSMKAIFSVKKIRKDGTEGKTSTMDPVEQLQIQDRTRNMWIHYSALDAKATYHLRQELMKKLDDQNVMACVMDKSLQDSYSNIKTMWDFYTEVWKPFGELLTNMENEGFYVNVVHLEEAQSLAEEDTIAAGERFRNWAKQNVPDAVYMNVNSDNQVRTLFYAGVKNRKTKVPVEMTKTFKCPNPDYDEHVRQNIPGKKPPRNKEFKLHGIWGEGVKSKLSPPIWTPSGEGVEKPDAQYKKNLKKFSMPVEGLGEIYMAFGGERKGLEACVAIESLLEVSAIEALLTSFIIPLQQDNIKTSNGRIHASLNINTETGRLSCRRPNLQNQPALEKDRYKVRKAFMADRRDGKRNTLIVADYGQLELRILAHLTGCKSMLEAFKSGGDFHSRTALGMYDYIKEAIDAGECILERDGGATRDEEPPVPLLKDKFPNERRKAKVLNFSLAYGKTIHGLAKDWNVSKKEAEETLNRWYADRMEVKEWQENVRKEARAVDGNYVTTIMGRRRRLPDLVSSSPGPRGHAERAATNTPIQGSAADIVTAAMLNIDRNERLKELGWKLLLQVHDEVILEGPEDSADEAQEIVVDCLEKPFPKPGGGHWNPLRVDLTVDSNVAHTWYDAK